MSVDDILDIIDAGLQSSTETGYPERYDRDDQCARCLTNEPAEGGDMCAGCRAFLLGDSEDDPNERRSVWGLSSTLLLDDWAAATVRSTDRWTLPFESWTWSAPDVSPFIDAMHEISAAFANVTVYQPLYLDELLRPVPPAWSEPEPDHSEAIATALDPSRMVWRPDADTIREQCASVMGDETPKPPRLAAAMAD